MADFDAALPVRQDTATSPWIVNVSNASLAVTGPLTDTELRATPVAVTATDLDIRDLAAVTDSVTAFQGTSPWVVSGTVAATQSGTWNIGTLTSITDPVAVTQSTSPWVVSGTVTANLGTIAGVATETTLAAINSKLVSGTVIGDVNAAQKGTWTVGLSEDHNWGTVGAATLRAAAQIGNATGAADFNTGNAGAQTLRVVIASNQPPLAVDVSGSADKDNRFAYNTAAAVAAGATSTHTFTPVADTYVTFIQASAAGQQKIEVKYGPTGSEVTIAVFFTSKSEPNLTWELADPLKVLTTESILILRKNTDNQAMDVYSTVQGYLA